jgi:hypothetical protein
MCASLFTRLCQNWNHVILDTMFFVGAENTPLQEHLLWSPSLAITSNTTADRPTSSYLISLPSQPLKQGQSQLSVEGWLLGLLGP